MSGFQQALEQGCAAVGLDPDDARLLRLGSNTVYHLNTPIIARISRLGVDVTPVRRSIAVARWLEAADYPAVRALHLDQPVLADGYVITFWQSISPDGNQFATTSEIAQILARLHRLTVPEDLHLPELDPFAESAHRLDASTWPTPEDRAFLTATLTRLQAAYATLEFELPQGPIHGDASIGNVLHDTHGNPVLIDLDGFATGPREWDLVLTAMYYDRFGWHTRQEYEDFASVYGYDVMQWPGYRTLADIREFLMVTWMVQKAEDPQFAPEAAKRISALRTGASRKDWQPA
jgi:aminoglycoside phosphotransferase (APT) family kinase protein